MSQTTDYRDLWTRLGLDLDKHDALLAALGQAYQETFLSQPHRPKGMQYFDFVMSEVHGLRIQELADARAAGRIVVGAFCVFVPEELVLAVDGICVGLCAGAEFGTEAAEAYLPRNTCALIKSFFGFTLKKVCPYVAACDLVVGENTCDGKKKAYEQFADLVPGDFLALDMPNTKSAPGRAVLRDAYQTLQERLETLSGKRVTPESLRAGIARVNAKRAALARLERLRQARPAPISGLDALLVNQVAFYDDPERFTEHVNQLADELEARVAAGEGVAPAEAPRLLVSGCPMAVPNWKVPALVESTGAVVVGEESCIGARGTQGMVAPEGASVPELLDALVDRYFQIDCAVFTPNSSRAHHALALARETGAQGVIHYALQFCTPYEMEAPRLARTVKDAGLPVLQIATGYSPSDQEQLRTRIEAFVEQIGDGSRPQA